MTFLSWHFFLLDLCVLPSNPPYHCLLRKPLNFEPPYKLYSLVKVREKGSGFLATFRDVLEGDQDPINTICTGIQWWLTPETPLLVLSGMLCSLGACVPMPGYWTQGLTNARQVSSRWAAFWLFILSFTWGRLFWGFPRWPWTRDVPASAYLIAGTLIALATILLCFLTQHLSVSKMLCVLLVYWFLYYSTIPTREDFLLSVCCVVPSTWRIVSA